MTLALLLSSLLGCSPQDGTGSGSFIYFAHEDTSENIAKLKHDGLDPRDASTYTDKGLVRAHCAAPAYDRPEDMSDRIKKLFTEKELELLSEDWAFYDEHCADLDIAWFPWLAFYNYLAKPGTFSSDGDNAAWRTEAVLTSEGDLQLTVHIDDDTFGDSRFGFSIDPDFQPTYCKDAETADGSPTLEPVDGDWVGNWSANESGKTLFLLNANSYQINPSNQDWDNPWYFPPEWNGGTAFGKFGEELLYNHPVDYADYNNGGDGLSTPMYVPQYTGDGFDPHPGDYTAFIEGVRATLSEGADESFRDFTAISDAMAGAEEGAEKLKMPFTLEVEDNSWRTDDEMASGLDNWVGVAASWVRFDISPEDLASIKAGKRDKPLTGSYQIFLEGAATASKFVVKGEFSIDNIRDDKWGYDPTLEAIKMEENKTPTCGE